MWTRRDGGNFWTLSSPQPLFDDDGGYLGSYVVMSDITERKQTEEALRASEARLAGVLDIAPDAIITTDKQGHMRMFNQGARETFGYQEHEVLGRSIELLIPEQFRDNHPRQMAEFGASGDRSRRMSERIGIFGLRKDGSTFAAEASVSRLDLDGETLYNVILRDISERKRIEEEILLAKELAEAASSAKSDFLANMSHELRTPLNAILGFSEVMVEESFGPLNNEKYKEYVVDIHNSGALLLDLINDVLDLSRVEAGVTDLNEGAVDLNAALRATIRIVHERAARKSLRIETDLAPSAPVIRGDERALKQIVLNLLSNCTKFTGEGGTISVTSKVEANGEVLLIVADSGIGIAAADIAKVLEPFGQIGGAHTREHEGTGLGLPFAKRLAEMHDAAFELASEPGVGTTVTVRFPPERRAEAGG
jgi:PAS domain S-box-containing protein